MPKASASQPKAAELPKTETSKTAAKQEAVNAAPKAPVSSVSVAPKTDAPQTATQSKAAASETAELPKVTATKAVEPQKATAQSSKIDVPKTNEKQASPKAVTSANTASNASRRPANENTVQRTETKDRTVASPAARVHPRNTEVGREEQSRPAVRQEALAGQEVPRHVKIGNDTFPLRPKEERPGLLRRIWNFVTRPFRGSGRRETEVEQTIERRAAQPGRDGNIAVRRNAENTDTRVRATANTASRTQSLSNAASNTESAKKSREANTVSGTQPVANPVSKSESTEKNATAKQTNANGFTIERVNQMEFIAPQSNANASFSIQRENSFEILANKTENKPEPKAAENKTENLEVQQEPQRTKKSLEELSREVNLMRAEREAETRKKNMERKQRAEAQREAEARKNGNLENIDRKKGKEKREEKKQEEKHGREKKYASGKKLTGKYGKGKGYVKG